MNTKNMISQNIKTLRKKKGVTQTQLAEETGLSMSAIRSYENGLREPNSKAMAALESYFHVTGEYLRGKDKEGTTYTWEDFEIMTAVKETFPNLINNLLSSFQNCSDLEQKMLFDILTELYHIANIQKEQPSFRSAAFLLLQENFTKITRFIDFCSRIPPMSDLEHDRMQRYKDTCIKEFEESINQFQDTLCK